MMPETTTPNSAASQQEDDALIAPRRIEFTIPGTPQQQGSKIVSRYGGMYDANKKLGPWRTEGIAAAQAAYEGPKIMATIIVMANFFFARPASHYGTGRNVARLKPNAPRFYNKTPDTDKLERAAGDVLTQAGLIIDDKLIAQWIAAKLWTTEAPRTEMTIWFAEDTGLYGHA